MLTTYFKFKRKEKRNQNAGRKRSDSLNEKCRKEDGIKRNLKYNSCHAAAHRSNSNQSKQTTCKIYYNAYALLHRQNNSINTTYKENRLNKKKNYTYMNFEQNTVRENCVKLR